MWFLVAGDVTTRYKTINVKTSLIQSGLNSGIHCLCKFSGFVFTHCGGPHICCKSKNGFRCYREQTTLIL